MEIRKEQAIIENVLEKLLRGEPPKKKSRKDRTKEERIQRILQSCEEYTKLNFLKALAHSVTL